ncbi:TolC family protein [Mucilaginibacter puniceus]
MKYILMRYKHAGIVITLLLFVVFTSNAQERISLQEAVDRTLANNLTVKQSLVNERLANEDYTQSKNNQLPSLSASPQAGYNFGRSAVPGQYVFANKSSFYVSGSASMQLTLFQGGQLHNQVLLNKLALDVSKGNTNKVKNDLVLNVVVTYLQILTNQDLVVAAKQQIDIATQTLDRTQISFDVGNQTLADLSQAKAQVSIANYNLTTAQNQLDLSKLVLLQLMEMDPNAEIIIEKPDISRLTNITTLYDATEVIKTAMNINPDVQLALARQLSSAQSIKIAKGTYLPTLSLFGSLGSNYSNAATQFIGQTPPVLQTIGTVQGTGQIVQTPVSQSIFGPYPFTSQFGNNFNQSIGVSLQIPIFNRFQARTNVRKAKLNYQNAELNTQIARNTLNKTIIQAVLDLQAANKQYISATQTFEANRDALNVTQERFNVGLVNTLNYNTALTNYNKAQNDMIQAQYTVIFRSKLIDYYLGNPISL